MVLQWTVVARRFLVVAEAMVVLLGVVLKMMVTASLGLAIAEVEAEEGLQGAGPRVGRARNSADRHASRWS